MDFADTIEIYVSSIDGVQVWIPVKSKRLENNQCLILNNNEFDCSDYSLLPEFIPGDTVLVGQKHFDDGEIKDVAQSLINPSSHPDKVFFEFLYYATHNDLPADKETFTKYRSVIQRVKDEYSKGKFFYPTIMEMIDKLRITV